MIKKNHNNKINNEKKTWKWYDILIHIHGTLLIRRVYVLVVVPSWAVQIIVTSAKLETPAGRLITDELVTTELIRTVAVESVLATETVTEFTVGLTDAV